MRHPESINTTFSLCFEKAQQANDAAIELLYLCAFLYPDEIPLEIITEGAIDLGPVLKLAADDPLKLNDVIAELRKFSLVRRNPDNKTFNIHRLVQAVLQDGMNVEMQRLWSERAVRIVNHVFPDVELAKWPLCQRYLSQAQTCTILIEQWTMKFKEAARLLSQLGIYLREHAQYHEAEKFLNQALAMHTELFGDEHPDVITSLMEIALLNRAQGSYQNAESLLKQALMIQERILGSDSPEVAEILNNLGLLYHDQKKYNQAEPLHSRALKIWEKTLGSEHPNVARAINNLAIFYHIQHGYKQSEILLTRAFKIYEKAIEAQSLNKASILNNLGWLSFMQDKYDEAESFYVRALNIYEQNLGFEHPNLSPILNNLAILYSKQIKYEKSESLLKKIISTYEQIFGSEHLTTAEKLQDLAEIYYVQGKYVQAEPLFTRVQAICKQTPNQSNQDATLCHERLTKIHQAWSNQASADAERLSNKLQMLLNESWWD